MRLRKRVKVNPFIQDDETEPDLNSQPTEALSEWRPENTESDDRSSKVRHKKPSHLRAVSEQQPHTRVSTPPRAAPRFNKKADRVLSVPPNFQWNARVQSMRAPSNETHLRTSDRALVNHANDLLSTFTKTKPRQSHHQPASNTLPAVGTPMQPISVSSDSSETSNNLGIISEDSGNIADNESSTSESEWDTITFVPEREVVSGSRVFVALPFIDPPFPWSLFVAFDDVFVPSQGAGRGDVGDLRGYKSA